MENESLIASRRLFFAVTGAAAAALAVPKSAQAAAMAEIEAANEKVVNDFCAAWETKDADKVGSYIGDDIEYSMIDEPKQELKKGKDVVIEPLRGFFKNASTVKFEVLRSAAIGNTVIHDRVDTFVTDGKEQRYHISGFFLVKHGKIVEWRDYLLPKADDVQ